MKKLKAVLVLYLLVSAAFLNAEETAVILARMDKAAAGFKGVAADLKMTSYNKLLDDKTEELGTLKMQRLKASDTRAIIDFSAQQDARIISFQGKNVRLFYPKRNEYDEIALGKQGNLLNQFLLLGFGSSGKELAASYVITNKGAEKIGSANTTRLLLEPKDSAVKERIERAEIWILENETYPVQQKFYEPAGNYQLVGYSKVVLNPAQQGKLELHMPSDAKRTKQ